MTTKYIYRYLDGTEVTITSEEAGEEMISILLKSDDEEHNSKRRDMYHKVEYLDAYDSDERGDADHNPYLADEDADPLNILVQEIDEVEYQEKLVRLRAALGDLTQKQKDLIRKRFYQRKTLTEIATEEGVSETAIRKRLKVIYSILKKKILK